MIDKKTILDFISHYRDCSKTFIYGQCYWFAVILTMRFHMFAPCELLYDPIANHFATEIDGKVYDATGETVRFGFLRWSDYAASDPLAANRIYRDCILQIEPEELETLPKHLQEYTKEYWF